LVFGGRRNKRRIRKKDLEEELEAGTQETQDGPDQTGNFLVDNGDPTPTMPKDPPSILKVSKPSKPSMLQVSQSGIFQGVNLAFGSLCQAGGTRRIYLRQNMQTSGIFKYFLQSWQS
jgi:hypothetical protein